MEITYDYYRIFYYVAQYGSFTKAASALLRGQPNITKAIGNLENQLGCKLFVRSNRGVTLTAEGEKLYEHVKIAYEQLHQAEKELLASADLTEGSVSIATTEIALYGTVLQALIDFKKDYPGVHIHLANYTNSDALLALKNGLADFAVVTLQENLDSDFDIRDLMNFQEILCCRKGYMDTSRAYEPAEVALSTFICQSKRTYSYKLIRAYFSQLGIDWEPEIEVAIVDQMLPLIKEGVGIGFIPDFLAKDLIDQGQIARILLKSPPLHRRITLARDRKRGLNLAARTFVEYLK